MWSTASLWFEVSVVTIFFLLGHIFLGHFEERSPSWRKLAKYIATLIIILLISVYFGRTVALSILGVALLPVIYIHGVVLPRKGINGWTGNQEEGTTTSEDGARIFLTTLLIKNN